MVWEIERVDLYEFDKAEDKMTYPSKEVLDYLADGWEPFQIIGESLWLKRQRPATYVRID